MRPARSRAGTRVLAALLALAAAIVFAAGAAPAAARPPLWIVRSKHATLVLFGSVHLLPPGLDWRPPALDDALARADELWFELPIDSRTDQRAAAATMARGALPTGQSLLHMLTPQEAAQLQVAAASLHLPPEAIDRMQPWMAELALSIAEDARGGATPTGGVEAEVQAITPARARRRAFETPEQQIGFLAGAPAADQLASLQWTVHEIDEDPAAYQRLVDDWMGGDMAGLQRDALDPLQTVSPTLYERLVGQRNRLWARTLGERLKGRGLVVVVVGVGHMVGPGGLPALLRAQGLDVEGP